MSAFSLHQTSLTPLELLICITGGLILFLAVAMIFRRRSRKPPASASPPPRGSSHIEAIKAAERAIVALARQKAASAGAFHFGAVDIHPKHLAFWITTPTDVDRDRLAADLELQAAFRRALADAGYPAEAVPEVGFAFQSQETVDRDHGGNWYYAVK